jgi:MFS family permease
MAFGLGALIATLSIAGIRSDLMKGRIFMFMGLFSGVTPILLAFSAVLPVAFLSCVAMGVSQAGFMALANTYVQRLAPDYLRGRISSLYILHAGGIMAFSNLGYGFAAELFSSRLILFVTGTLFIVVLITMGMGHPFFRRIYKTGKISLA